MKAYFIFVIVLTAAYIVYYAVMIARDLYGNGNKQKSDEEEFDVSDFASEESVSVVENDNGFNIGDNEYETHYVSETQNVTDEKNNNDEKAKQNIAEKLNEEVLSGMEETQVTFSDPYNATELYKLMLKNGVGSHQPHVGVTAKPAIDEL